MTKEAALNAFWGRFGVPAYDENSVPDDKPNMYITYEVATGNFGEQVALSASIWHWHTWSWVAINTKAREIAEFLGLGGVYLRCDGGAIHIRQGSPFARSSEDEEVKQKYINITAEFITEV